MDNNINISADFIIECANKRKKWEEARNVQSNYKASLIDLANTLAVNDELDLKSKYWMQDIDKELKRVKRNSDCALSNSTLVNYYESCGLDSSDYFLTKEEEQYIDNNIVHYEIGKIEVPEKPELRELDSVPSKPIVKHGALCLAAGIILDILGLFWLILGGLKLTIIVGIVCTVLGIISAGREDKYNKYNEDKNYNDNIFPEKIAAYNQTVETLEKAINQKTKNVEIIKSIIDRKTKIEDQRDSDIEGKIAEIDNLIYDNYMSRQYFRNANSNSVGSSVWSSDELIEIAAIAKSGRVESLNDAADKYIEECRREQERQERLAEEARREVEEMRIREEIRQLKKEVEFRDYLRKR